LCSRGCSARRYAFAPRQHLQIISRGRPGAIDGDTLEIHGMRIRLWGIDAPESSQLCRDDDGLRYQCGAKAANELDGFIARRPVDCSPVSLDQYGRTVAACSVDGVDIAEWLVRNGLALDWPLYSNGKYDKSQSEADRAGRGIWAGSYVAPWLFRACIRQGGTGRLFGRCELASLIQGK
jgi:endonuclease YncB( thermonuclease family)